jgi:hypothetical protein
MMALLYHADEAASSVGLHLYEYFMIAMVFDYHN